MLGLVTTPNGKATPSNCASCRNRSRSVTKRSLRSTHFRSTAASCGRYATMGKAGCPGRMSPASCCSQADDGSGPPAGTRVVALTDEFGWAQRVAVPGHRMAALPENVSFSQAATLPVAGLTALRTLRHGAPLLGKRVLITGAAGGVGTIAVQLGGAFGRARHGCGWAAGTRGGDQGTRRDEVVEGIDNAQGRFGLILESAGGASLAQSDPACRGQGNGRGVRQLVGRADHARLRRFSWCAEFARAELPLFHLRSRGPVRAGSRVARVPDRRRIAQAADRCRMQLARYCRRSAEQLRDRRVSGKAVLLVDAG